MLVNVAMLKHLVQQTDSICKLSIAQVGLQEPEEGQQQALEVGPPLVTGGQQQLGHQVAVADQLQPGKRKPRHPQRLHHSPMLVHSMKFCWIHLWTHVLQQQS